MRKETHLGQFKTMNSDRIATPVIRTSMFMAVGRSGRAVFLNVPVHAGDTDQMITQRATEAARQFFHDGNNGNPARAIREGYWLHHNPKIPEKLIRFHRIEEVEFLYENTMAA